MKLRLGRNGESAVSGELRKAAAPAEVCIYLAFARGRSIPPAPQ